MELIWKIGKREAAAITRFVRKQESNAFVRQRVRRNVEGELPNRTKTLVWHALATCLLTTQQRSGPQSQVNAFITLRPFPIRYNLVRTKKSVSRFIAAEIRGFGGLRRADTIGKELADNARWFEGDNWRELSDKLELCADSKEYVQERQVARWVASEFRGLGPKQSRNFLQCLGLTRYEVPIDSRIAKWLNTIGFPVTLNAKALSDPNYYEFVSDGLREIASAAGVLPCVLDAAVFSAVDGDSWNEAKIVF